MHKWMTTLCCMGILFVAQAQDDVNQCYRKDAGGLIREHNVDFRTLDLYVAFKPEDGLVEGRAFYTFAPIQPQVDSVFLDGPGIRVDNIELDANNTRFKIDSAGITVFFDPPLQRNAEHTLQIFYAANPKRGIYFNGWNVAQTDNPNDPTIKRKQIWTQGQGIDNRHWIPSYDGLNDKVITNLHITFDSSYQVISNGRLMTKEVSKNGTYTWHYSMSHPHAMYLIMLAIGKYGHLDYKSKNGITTTQYYYPGTETYAENTYRYTAELMDWMASSTGVKYPWETYANVPVQEFLYGAMENTTATIFSDFFYQLPASNPDKQYIEINAHELTHQWFGDYITAWSGSSHWLQESFATYYAKHFAQHIYGDDYYNWKRREEMLTAIQADISNDINVANSSAGSPLVYQKGSFVIDMLRYVVGDESFNIAITDFLQSHPYTNVSSQDFEMQFMKSLGMNMHWFFDEWIYRDGFPVYAVKWNALQTRTDVTVQQAQAQTATSKLFTMPIHIQVHYLDGSYDEQRITIADSSTVISFANPDKKPVAFVLFNPNTMVLSTLDFPKPYGELKLQAFNAPNMLDRYDAVVAMRDSPIDVKRADLITLFNREQFHAIKSEIVAQLSGDADKSSIQLLKSAVYDKDPLVRRSVLVNMKELPGKMEKDIASLLHDDNYVNIEIALRRLYEFDPKHIETYLQETNGVYGATNNVRIAWLEIMCREHDNAVISQLIAMSSSQYEFRTRVAAMNTIAGLTYCNEQLVSHLFDALISPNHRLSNPARTILLNYKKNPDYAAMIKSYYEGHMWSDWENRRIGTVKD